MMVATYLKNKIVEVEGMRKEILADGKIKVTVKQLNKVFIAESEKEALEIVFKMLGGAK